MVCIAPRISPRLLVALELAERPSLPIAEVCRRVGVAAERLGLPQPSYESVRVLVHDLRRRRREPTTGAVLVDIAFRARPPDALLDHLSGVGVPRLRSS